MSVRFSQEHEWARLDDDGALTIGVTAHAAESLGEVVFVELPTVGDEVEAGQVVGTIESVKAVGDLFCPCGGEIVSVNADLVDAPEQLNADPTGAAWLFKVKPNDLAEFEALMDQAAYDAFIAG
ncbi:glycine cleavage system protein GcvH [Myxococcota bacterium]|nr:glycine cleavage system protein GcvH [Myxococcota bacterium]MBU1431947.1 glycine cleavage system protein GcvH [Myxococcota bacterium]MBU1898821.1 glycine cleavage system protein GcvH [Myxococcota bacterium]